MKNLCIAVKKMPQIKNIDVRDVRTLSEKQIIMFACEVTRTAISQGKDVIIQYYNYESDSDYRKMRVQNKKWEHNDLLKIKISSYYVYKESFFQRIIAFVQKQSKDHRAFIVVGETKL